MKRVFAVVFTVLAVAATGGTARNAGAVLPPGNSVEQWNKIAENTVVGPARSRTRV